MDKTKQADFSIFKESLSPATFGCFREIFENAKNTIKKGSMQGRYELPLKLVMEAGSIGDVDAVAKSIKEIIQCKVKYKKEDYLIFFPFFASVCIEDGMVRYTIPRELEEVIPSISIDAIDKPAGQ